MNAMHIEVQPKRIIREWPRVEKYQNSTLRYSPPMDFPAYWVRQNFRPKIIRTWVTLDEIWNLLTDEYDWNYQIGVDKLGDKRTYRYDWTDTRPSDTHFEDYLTSYCAMAEEAMLTVRRFERELADGILSYEKYEEVFERVVEHCRDLCENIVYIEVSNETEAPEFGRLTIEEYMRMYDAACRAITRLNRRRGWNLQVGGNAMTDRFFLKHGGWRAYMQALAEDREPDLRIDFYSFHIYHSDPSRLRQLYSAHRACLKKYGLPDAPVFLDEIGTQYCSGEPIEGLKNASRVMRHLLLSSDLENCSLFPWCTFHNPELQMSFTQYIRLPEGGYAPMPNGLSVHMLGLMLRDEVVVKGDWCGRVRAAREDRKMTILLTNPDDEPLAVNCTIEELEGTKVRICMSHVDEKNNNAVMNPPCTELTVTETMELPIVNGAVHVSCVMPRFGFSCWNIDIE